VVVEAGIASPGRVAMESSRTKEADTRGVSGS
jgi:hypothetical protein